MRTPSLATEPSTIVSDTFVQTRVRQSYDGTYTCTVTIGASLMSRSVSLTVSGEFVMLNMLDVNYAAIHAAMHA